jgi:hypothetical protein
MPFAFVGVSTLDPLHAPAWCCYQRVTASANKSSLYRSHEPSLLNLSGAGLVGQMLCNSQTCAIFFTKFYSLASVVGTPPALLNAAYTTTAQQRNTNAGKGK